MLSTAAESLPTDDASSKFSLYQGFVVGLCALVAMLDGFDTQAIAFVAPVIAKSWGAPVAGFGPVFAVGLFAGILGSVAFGVVADRRGRRVTIIATTAMIAAGSLLTLLSKGMVDLTAYRFFTGFGLGGAIPSIVALSAEYSPPRIRATVVTAMFCGIPLGAVLGAAASVPLIKSGGWPAVFLAGGIIPLLLLPVLMWRLPESIGWLKANGKAELAEKIRSRTHLPSLSAPVDGLAVKPAPAKITALLASGRAMATLCLWSTFFLSLLLVFFLVSWIPSIAVAETASPSMGAMAAAVLNFGGIAGALVIGRLIDRFGAFAVVGSAYVLGACGMMAIGLGPDARASVFMFSLVGGFFGMGAQLCVVAIAADFYPLTLRATGVGAAMGAGRFGAITGSLVGGALLAGVGGAARFPPVLSGLAIAACVAVLGAGFFKRRESKD
ncbi:MAG TPA: MFS transporter [Caulobacteraceae bacterium]|jgi:AAHS family 4-hydroxybenzoate transporter-like MFS transporter|nr:MFS transporter [Caulobacteraceae bacterium]